MDELLSDALAEKHAAISHLKSTWVSDQTSPENLQGSFSRGENVETVLQNHVNDTLQFLSTHFKESDSLTRAKAAVDAIHKRYKVQGMLSKQVLGNAKPLDSTVEVEKEHARVTVAETTVQQESDTDSLQEVGAYFEGNRFQKVGFVGLVF